MDLAKFIPAEMRLELAQRVIEETGIRPLARQIDVNPKSVYKYKRGTSHPGDEIMEKILAVAAKEDSIPLNEYLERLRENFSEALGGSIDPQEVLGSGEGEPKSGPKEQTESGIVDQKSTEKPQKEEKGVGERPTDNIRFDELCDSMGVSTPFERSKLEKFVDAFSEFPEIDFDEIIELSGLSESAVEKYIDKMKSDGFIKETSEDSYQILVSVEGED